jgi:hypothetical protein
MPAHLWECDSTDKYLIFVVLELLLYKNTPLRHHMALNIKIKWQVFPQRNLMLSCLLCCWKYFFYCWLPVLFYLSTFLTSSSFCMCSSNIKMSFYRESNLSLDHKARSLSTSGQFWPLNSFLVTHCCLSYLESVAYLAWVVALKIV